MPMHRLYINRPLASGDTLTLDGERARYLGRVLRCRPGDHITLFDGSGSECLSQVASLSRQSVTLDVGEAVYPRVESTLNLRLIQCLSKGERMDLVVQKATELGVQRISAAHSEFSVVRLSGERADKRRAHWQRIAESACEQSGRVIPPHLDAPMPLHILLAEATQPGTTRLMLQPGAVTGPADVTPGSAKVELLVGPEGGLADGEREQARNAGFQEIAFGPRVLRTETAAIAALAVVQSLWGDLSAG